MDSILESIKKLLGIPKDYTAFDADIIMHINTVFFYLSQINGPKFSIEGYDETWDLYFGDRINRLESVKSYIYLRVRLLFDPPTSSGLIEAMKAQILELEWRLEIEGDESA